MALKPITDYSLYCLREKKFTPTKQHALKQASNGTMMIKGICTSCGAKKSRFVTDDYQHYKRK
jgi:hypothetical protein